MMLRELEMKTLEYNRQDTELAKQIEVIKTDIKEIDEQIISLNKLQHMFADRPNVSILKPLFTSSKNKHLSTFVPPETATPVKPEKQRNPPHGTMSSNKTSDQLQTSEDYQRSKKKRCTDEIETSKTDIDEDKSTCNPPKELFSNDNIVVNISPVSTAMTIMPMMPIPVHKSTNTLIAHQDHVRIHILANVTTSTYCKYSTSKPRPRIIVLSYNKQLTINRGQKYTLERVTESKPFLIKVPPVYPHQPLFLTLIPKDPTNSVKSGKPSYTNSLSSITPSLKYMKSSLKMPTFKTHPQMHCLTLLAMIFLIFASLLQVAEASGMQSTFTMYSANANGLCHSVKLVHINRSINKLKPSVFILNESKTNTKVSGNLPHSEYEIMEESGVKCDQGHLYKWGNVLGICKDIQIVQ